MTMTVEPWRRAWRDGALPLLSDGQLQSLLGALERDDPRLMQGGTTTPPPLACVRDWPVEAACLLGYCGWQPDDPDNPVMGTVGEVGEFFARMCYEIDIRLGEPAGCRHLLNWFDDTPREEMVRLLTEEVAQNLAERRQPDDIPF